MLHVSGLASGAAPADASAVGHVLDEFSASVWTPDWLPQLKPWRQVIEEFMSLLAAAECMVQLVAMLLRHERQRSIAGRIGIFVAVPKDLARSSRRKICFSHLFHQGIGIGHP